MSTSLGVDRETKAEILFAQQATRLWRALVAYTSDRDVADDALAEAFAQLLARGDHVRAPDRWVWTAAFKIAAGELKERGKSDPLPEAAYEMPEGGQDLARALLRLSPKQRAALILRYYAGYSTVEISQILGSSVPTVRVHMSQGRKRLRRIMEREHD